MKTLRYAVLAGVSLSALISTAFAQDKKLAGRVTDVRSGQPVSVGVVKVKGTNLTDRLRLDGVFVLDVDRSDVTLIVQGEGYETREIFVGARQEAVLVELRSSAYLLEDAVVLGDEATGPGESILEGAELDRVPALTVAEQLMGRVGGLNVQQNSGAPGDIFMQIRGTATLQGSAQPLFIVDGIVINSSTLPSGASAVTGGEDVLMSRIVDINPRDIKTVQVLRGAAATTRYGSRGANGVVLISTKRGR